LPERVAQDSCQLANRWRLDPTLAGMVVGLEAWAQARLADEGLPWPGLFIISGYRSQQRQAVVNPSSPNSLHTHCPALAVDLRIGSVAGAGAEQIWQWLGARWKLLGGRWGGDFSSPDLNHFDLGVGPA